MTIFNINANACVVCEKIIHYFINPACLKEVIIWLDGGQKIRCAYDSKEIAKDSFDTLDKIMRNPLK